MVLHFVSNWAYENPINGSVNITILIVYSLAIILNKNDSFQILQDNLFFYRKIVLPTHHMLPQVMKKRRAQRYGEL